MEVETDVVPQTTTTAAPPSITEEPNLLDISSSPAASLPEESTDNGADATQNGAVLLLDDPVVLKTVKVTSANDDFTPPSAYQQPNLLDSASPLPEVSTDSGAQSTQELVGVSLLDDPAVPKTEEVASANDDFTPQSVTTSMSATEEPNLLDSASPFPKESTGSGTQTTQNGAVSLLDDPAVPKTEEATSANDDTDMTSPPPTITENGIADDEGMLLELTGPSPTATKADSDPFIQKCATPEGFESNQEPSQDVPATTTSASTTGAEKGAASPSDEHLSTQNVASPDTKETLPSSLAVASSSSAMVDTNDETNVPPSSDNTLTSSPTENGNEAALSSNAPSSISALPATKTVERSPPILSQPEVAATNDSSSGASAVPVVASEDAQDTVATVPQEVQQSEFETLQAELAQAQQFIESLLGEKEQQAEQENKDNSSLMEELQSTLQEQMSLKAEAENKVRLVNDRVQRLETQNKELAIELAGFSDLEFNLQQQMSSKAEAENNVRLVNDRVQRLETRNKELVSEVAGFSDLELNLQQQMSSKAEAENKVRLTEQRVQELENEAKEQAMGMEKLQRELVSMREERAAEEQEVEKIREQRADQERREIALTNRLNAAKKKEATKSNLAEQYEEDYKSLEQESEELKRELHELKERKQKMEQELGEARKLAQERFEESDRSLAEELRLNEERKRKMKAFVENKSEELREAKADNDALQTEATQTSRALMDLNTRYKQLHAQWVQSQTRNRELQRDLNRIKKDSDNLHKVGDTLEMKLSRSANETEEHKNKRLAAKHELMTVLRTLEVERDVSNKLRDSIKFTFTPKALSQQQLLKESLEEFEAQLLKLSQRLGKPLPPPANVSGDVSMNDLSERSAGVDMDIVEVNGDGKRSEADMNRLIAKLEYETQHVSQCIMALTGGVERMNVLLDASGNRTCFTSLSEILTTGGVTTAASREETASMTGGRPLVSIHSSPRYGRVPAATPLR